MRHLLKIEKPFLEALLDGTKTFEVRRNDRGYQKGDVLAFDRDASMFPSESPHCRKVEFTVTYVLSGWGIEPGFVVLGLDAGDAGVHERIAEAIFNEEQQLTQVITNNPTDPHYSGVLRGLQRARDIAAEFTRAAAGTPEVDPADWAGDSPDWTLS